MHLTFFFLKFLGVFHALTLMICSFLLLLRSLHPHAAAGDLQSHVSAALVFVLHTKYRL